MLGREVGAGRGETVMKYDEDLNIPMIAGVSAIAVVLILAALVGGQGLFYRLKDRENQVKNVAPAPEEFTKYTIEQEGRLNGYGWLDRNKGIVAIPIETAMEAAARELEKERTTPGK